MNITLERDALAKAIGHATAVVEKRVTIPVLSNVLIEAEGEMARIVATDLEIQIAVRIRAGVTVPGKVTVAAQLFAGIVRELDDGSQVGIELKSDKLHVISGRSRYQLPTLPADDFPAMRRPEPKAAFCLAVADMAAALKSVAYAQSAEETQFNLMGVHIDARDGRLTFAATNRHILASVSRSAPDGSGGLETGITVPRKLVGELIRMLEASEGEIDLVTDCELIRFTLGDSEVIGKLIDGEYPDWRRAVPSDHPETLKVRTASLAAAVRRAVLVAEDKTRSVRADFRNDIVLVSSRGALSGSAEEEVPCTYPGGEFAVGLNSRYVLDTLDALGAEEIECALQPQGVGGSAASILFTSPARPDGQWVIMPMRV